MNYVALILSFLVGGSSLAVAQTVGAPTGNSAASGTAATGAGGSPGPNTSNALNHGTTGSNVGPTSAAQGAPSHGNAVDTPAANSATNSLSNTDTGILKK